MSTNDQDQMFYNASPEIVEKANDLRKNMDLSELKLWEYLKDKKMLNLQFYAQHPMDRFIADFYCHKLKLIIEIDDEIHPSKEQSKYDIEQEAELEKLGVEVIRFKSEDINQNIDHVIENIKIACAQRSLKLNSLL
jgi:very-short-patch-repair endonuclease